MSTAPKTERRKAERPRKTPPRPSAVVIPFPTCAVSRKAPQEGEARGEILLFLGVRYERLAS